MKKNGVVILGFILFGISSGISELVMQRALDGSFIVGSRVSDCEGEAFLNMNLDMSHISWMREHLTHCTISFPSVSGLNDLLFHDPDAMYHCFDDSRPALAIGPRSHMVQVYGGIDVIKSEMLVRFGGSLQNFISTNCSPGTILEMRSIATESQSVTIARFELFDAVSNQYLNTTARAPVYIAVEEFAGQKSLATFPFSLGSRLDSILTSHGATRIVNDPHVRLPLSRVGVWSYTNCTGETISFLPNLVVELFNEMDELTGSIVLNPEEYISNCEFRVDDGTIEHVSTDQTFLSLDIFQIPQTNIRIESDRIFICDFLAR